MNVVFWWKRKHYWCRRCAQRMFSGSPSWQNNFWIWQLWYSLRCLEGWKCCVLRELEVHKFFLRNLLLYLPGEPSVWQKHSSWAADAARFLFPLVVLLKLRFCNSVSAWLNTQMSCEVILTRRDGKGNEFFHSACHTITPRHALVYIAPTLGGHKPLHTQAERCLTALPACEWTLQKAFTTDQVWFLLVRFPIQSQTLKNSCFLRIKARCWKTKL